MSLIKKLVSKISIKSFILSNFGLFLSSIASSIFISPSKMVASGGVGLATFFSYFTNIPFYVYLYGINILLIIISFFTLGKKFTLKTIYGSIMLPTYSLLISFILELFHISSSTLLLYLSGVDAIVVVLFASVLMGIGVGIKCEK